MSGEHAGVRVPASVAVLLEKEVSNGCLGLGFPPGIEEMIILSCFSRG